MERGRRSLSLALSILCARAVDPRASAPRDWLFTVSCRARAWPQGLNIRVAGGDGLAEFDALGKISLLCGGCYVCLLNGVQSVWVEDAV